jgi:uncharacterized protein
MRRVLASLLVVAAAAWSTLPARALDVPPLGARVNDAAQLLSSGEREALEGKLAAYEAQSGQQFVLLTVPSLEGDPIEDFSIRVAEKWKIGQRGKDDGLILIVARDERKMRIEVGYGLEGELTDVFTSRVIRDILTPAFREGAFARGLNAGFDALIAKASGQPVPESRPVEVARRPPRKLRLAPLLLALLVFLFFGGGGRGWRRRRSAFPFFMMGGGGFGGGGGGFGGGRGGGGFGGGGGGGFGGGGASGGW